MKFIDLTRCSIVKSLAGRINISNARQFSLVPVAERDGQLIIATTDPASAQLDNFSLGVRTPIQIGLAAPKAFRNAFRDLYHESFFSVEIDRLTDAKADEAPVVRLVNEILVEATLAGASDVYIEPQEKEVRVRFKVDGVARIIPYGIASHLLPNIMSRIKNAAAMDLAERRLPQGGSFRFSIPNARRTMDARVAIQPTIRGETMCIRLLEQTRTIAGLHELGLSRTNLDWMRRMVAQPNGIILVTGPTGSGKTTTLYAALQELNEPGRKIMTVEDPVEYQIEGIDQTQVNPVIGLNFLDVLRTALRMAPNVLLIGEIRDLESARIAIQSAQTGHLVFSTLHTNDAPSSVTRLSDLGIEPFLVAETVRGVVAQRLVRSLCESCAKTATPTRDQLRSLGIEAESGSALKFKMAVGCDCCDNQGYRGRLPVFERLEVSEELAELVRARASSVTIRTKAVELGLLRSFLVDARERVLSGQTSFDEVRAVLGL